jgi:CheY-like chemotaxis protein
VVRRPPGSDVPVTVLTVDDQPVFLHAVRMLIAATGSGAQALRLAADLRPDLVLVDVRMPGMDGMETARRLRRQDPSVVVILVSLEEVVDLPSSLATAGAAAHIRKQELSPHTLQRLWAMHGRPLAAQR